MVVRDPPTTDRGAPARPPQPTARNPASSLDPELVLHLLQGKPDGPFGDASRLQRRPQYIVEGALEAATQQGQALIYREDRRTSAVRRQVRGGRGPMVDRWKNLGGKRSKVVLRLKGGHRPAAAEPNLVIVLRKGKVLREGLPSLRYDQYCLGTVSDEGRVDEQVDGANVYHVAGLDPKASEAGGCAKRHKVHDTAVRAAVQAAAQAGPAEEPPLPPSAQGEGAAAAAAAAVAVAGAGAGAAAAGLAAAEALSEFWSSTSSSSSDDDEPARLGQDPRPHRGNPSPSLAQRALV